MPRSPCKCEKCKCSSKHSCSSDGWVVSPTKTSGDRRLFDLKEESGANLATRTLEDFFEKCAGYNLRYCSITGYIKHSDNYFRHMLKDVVVLICFVATNFVVFVAITSKAIVHMLLFFSITVQWIIKTFIIRNSATDWKESWSPRPLKQFEMQSAFKTD